MEHKHTFFKEDAPWKMQAGMFFRSMGLGKFISDCENKGYKIYGIAFNDENICELLFEEPKK